MVRAAFKGDGRNFHPPLASFSVLGMAEDKNDNASGNRDQPSSDEAALSARLGSLDHRLSEIRDSRKIRTDQPGTESGDKAARASAMALGFRLSSELVAGVPQFLAVEPKLRESSACRRPAPVQRHHR